MNAKRKKEKKGVRGTKENVYPSSIPTKLEQ